MIVIAKEPRPGRVKTRLVPPLTPQQAADVAAAALRDTLRTVGDVAADAKVLAFAGDAANWTPPGWRAVTQPDGGLDARLAAAFDTARSGPALLVGMDTPQLHADQLDFDTEHYDACLGLAADGGFWAIGFADPTLAAATIPGVAMSTDHTGADQLARLRGHGLRVQLLDELTDVDTIETAHEVARVIPGSTFAAVLARCGTIAS